jgi:hypothetical protein
MYTKNSKVIQLSLLCLLVFISGAKAETNIIDFESGRWVFEDSDAKVVNHLGRKSLHLGFGRAYLKDVEFENGITEVDMAFEGSRDFPAINFRIQSRDNYEHFYPRPHKTNRPDALQYIPVFNGSGGWQLYNGKKFTAKTSIPHKRWVHFKLEISGKQARAYVDGANKPALVIDDLKHGISKGTLGLNGWTGNTYFSNFSFKADNNLKFKSVPKPDTPIGMITQWQLSQIFESNQINTKLPLAEQKLANIKWQKVKGEASGLVDIARYVKKSEREQEVVLAKVVVHSEKEQIKKLSFGYSDKVSIFLNDDILFSGNYSFRKREAEFVGVVGLNDAVYLNLKKGDNELLLMITETFGGWGYICQLEDMEGIIIKNDN